MSLRPRAGWLLVFAVALAGCFDQIPPDDDAGAIIPDDRPSLPDTSTKMDSPVATDDGRTDATVGADVVAPVDLGPPCTTSADCADGRLCGSDNRCAACVPTDDRCPAAQHCDPTSLGCVPGCRSDEGCSASARPDGGSAPARCDTSRHVCLDCDLDDDCPVRSVCRAGVCTPGCNERRGCGAGEVCCDGTCADVQASLSNCGACGRSCSVSNGVARCMAGECGLAACTPGFADCNGMLADGCEASLQTDPTRCGSCDVSCPTPMGAGSVACAGGRCGFVCAEGTADCDGDARNGCERTTTRDASHCGRCNNACPARTNAAMPRCDMGVCGVNCNAGFGDCDGDAANGCEANTRTSVSQCGGCGMACPAVANATPTCAASRCGFTCNAGYGDCDGDAANGCETDTRTAAAHCGRCGSACIVAGGTAACVAGACTVGRCEANAADCDGNAANGCETDTRTTAAHCGGCGRACPAAAHSVASCAAGACGVRCETGWGDCDGNAANGCEVDLTTSPTNCGACGATSATEVCDGRDNDCDRAVDEGCPTAIGGLTTFEFTSTEFGAGTGATMYANCSNGQVARGVYGTTSGIVVTSFGVICGTASLVEDGSVTPHRYNVSLAGSVDAGVVGNGAFGSPVAFRFQCPGNAVVTRVNGMVGPLVYQLAVTCSTLSVTGSPASPRVTATAAGSSPNFGGGTAGTVFDYACPANAAGSTSALRSLFGRQNTILPTFVIVGSIGARCSAPTITVR